MPDESAPSDERYTDIFFVEEEALLAHDTSVHDADSGDQLQRDLDCVRLLRKALAAPRPRASPAGLPWKQLGRFTLLRELGRGGFGIVYLAHDPKLARNVALKVPHPESLVTPELQQRFEREARSASILDHPNIVPIHEADAVGPVCFIVSAYCPGTTLARWLAGHGDPVPIPEAAGLVATLAEAAGHAHRRGIVHRDLKPANILLESGAEGEGQVRIQVATPRIADFGLARNLLDTSDDALTRTGAFVGTPGYMAPEQAGGKRQEIGPPADVYALGVILYELLTGRPPFSGETPLDTLMLVREAEPVPPGRLRPRVPRDLETICLKCLEKSPEWRYADGAGLAADLRRFLDGRPVLARPIGGVEQFRRWCGRHPGVVGMSVLVVFLLTAMTGGALVAAWQQADLAKKALEAGEREREKGEHVEELLVRELVGRGWRYSETGDQPSALPLFAEVLRRDEGKPEREPMHRLRLACALRRNLRMHQVFFHEAGVNWVEVSPDGKRAATASDDWTARVWDVETGRPVTPPLRHEGRVFRANFSPDGTRLVTTAQAWTAGNIRGVTRFWDAATGRASDLSLPDRSFLDAGTQFSPDGKRFLSINPGGCQLHDAETGEPVGPLMPSDEDLIHVAFSPDGGRIVSTGSNGVVRLWEAATGKLLAELKHPKKVLATAFHPAGRILAAGSSDFGMYVWDTVEKKVIGGLNFQGNVSHLCFSADGRYLAAASWDRTVRVFTADKLTPVWTRTHTSRVTGLAAPKDFGIIVAAGDDGTIQGWWLENGSRSFAMFRHTGGVNHLTFGPNRTPFVLATASADGTARLFVRPAVALGFSGQGGFTRWMAYSHAGDRLVTCTHDAARKSHAANLLDARTREPLAGPMRHDGLIYRAAFSPDDRLLATAGADRVARLWDAKTGKMLRELRHDHEVRTVEFSRDGRTVLTSESAEGLMSLPSKARIWEVATGRPIRAFEHRGGVTQASFGPDDRLVLTACQDGQARVWRADGGELVLSLRKTRPVEQALFSSDGKRILTRTTESAYLWDAETGQQLGQPMTPKGTLRWVEFSPNGERLVTAGDIGAQVWDAGTGTRVGQMLTHPGRIFHATFSPSGDLVATGGEYGYSRIWNATTGFGVHGATPGHFGWVYHGAFSPDGSTFVSVGGSPTLAAWDIRSDARPVKDLVALAELASGHRLGEHGVEPLELEAFREGWGRLWRKYPGDLPGDPEPPPGWEGRKYYREGRKRLVYSQWEEAEREYARAVELLPGDPGPVRELEYARKQIAKAKAKE